MIKNKRIAHRVEGERYAWHFCADYMIWWFLVICTKSELFETFVLFSIDKLVQMCYNVIVTAEKQWAAATNDAAAHINLFNLR